MKWLLGSNLSQHKLCWLWMNDPLWHPWMGLWFCVWQRTYDQHSRVLPPLQPGSRLAIPSRTDTDWFLLGTIFELCHHRTYVVQSGKGSVLIQNRRFSKPVHWLLFFNAPDVNETHTPGPKGLDLTRLLPGRMVTDQIEPCITCRLRPIDVSRSENTPASASLPTSIWKLKSPDKISDSGNKIIDSR